MRILIIEDEQRLAEALKHILLKHNYIADTFYDGESGLDNALTGVYDAIILDIMLPKMDGISVLKEMRKEKINTPVLLLTAKDEVADKVNGLDSGADDYLTKPFETEELLARIRAMTRRKGDVFSENIIFGNTSIDEKSAELQCGEFSIKLSLKEFHIARLLFSNPKQVVSKDIIIDKIWGFDTDADSNNVEVYISFLRKKLDNIGSNVEIKASRGLGYYLEEK